MLIKFSRDYRGKLTREIFYTAGTEVDFDSDVAVQIIAEFAAIAVEQPTEETPAEEAPQPKRKRRKSVDVEE